MWHVLQEMLEGNTRYREGRMLRQRQDSDRRREIAAGQRPMAALVCCSDSRVSPEIIFDQGLGDLFIVRVAGNILSDITVGSLEYAVEHLGVPLVMVLGHTRCGAVTAAVRGGHAQGRIASIIEALRPAVEDARSREEGDVVEAAARIHVEHAVHALAHAEPMFARLVHEGKLAIAGALYDLDSGAVEIVSRVEPTAE